MICSEKKLKIQFKPLHTFTECANIFSKLIREISKKDITNNLRKKKNQLSHTSGQPILIKQELEKLMKVINLTQHLREKMIEPVLKLFHQTGSYLI